LVKHVKLTCVTDATNGLLPKETTITRLERKSVWFYIALGPTLKMSITSTAY